MPLKNLMGVHRTTTTSETRLSNATTVVKSGTFTETWILKRHSRVASAMRRNTRLINQYPITHSRLWWRGDHKGRGRIFHRKLTSNQPHYIAKTYWFSSTTSMLQLQVTIGNVKYVPVNLFGSVDLVISNENSAQQRQVRLKEALLEHS